MKLQNLEKFQFFSHSRGTKCRVKANNNREAFVVCARYFVKPPSKRSALVYNISTLGLKQTLWTYVTPVYGTLRMQKTVSRLFIVEEEAYLGMELIASEFQEQLRDSADKIERKDHKRVI